MGDLGDRWNRWRARRSPYTQVLIFWVGLVVVVGIVFPLVDLYDWVRARFDTYNEGGDDG